MDEESKLMSKIKKNPSVPIGLAGCLAVVIYGLYNIKNKKLKTSVYLIHLRVAAQGTVIGTISLGLIYSLCKNHLHKLLSGTEKKN